MKTTKYGTETRRKVQFPPLCHDALLLKEVAPVGPRGAFLEAPCRAFCGRRAVLEAFFTHFAAFCWPPHLSPGLAAAAEESPRKTHTHIYMEICNFLPWQKGCSVFWRRFQHFCGLFQAFYAQMGCFCGLSQGFYAKRAAPEAFSQAFCASGGGFQGFLPNSGAPAGRPAGPQKGPA